MLPMQRAVWLVETHQNHEAVSVAGGKMPRMEAWLILTLSTKLGLRILASMRQLIQPPLMSMAKNVAASAECDEGDGATYGDDEGATDGGAEGGLASDGGVKGGLASDDEYDIA